MLAIHCTQCGTEIHAWDKLCPQCGNRPKRSWHRSRNNLIGLLAVVGLIVFVAWNPLATSDEPMIVQSEVGSQPSVMFNSPTAVPTPAPKRIGQRARTANWEIVVLEKPTILVQNRDFRGTPVAVKVRVKNVGNEGSTIYGFQFELEHGTGRVYKTTSVYSDKALSAEDINPGLQYEGYVLFDVPSSALVQNKWWRLVVDGAMFQDSAIIQLSFQGRWTDMRQQ